MKQLKLHSQNMKSIAIAIQAAGGSVDVLLSKEVLSFLETLAQNAVSLNAKFQQEPIIGNDWTINTTDGHPDLKVNDRVEVEIANSDDNNDGWIINTKTSIGHALDVGPDDLVDFVDSKGDTLLGTVAVEWTHPWNVNNAYHIIQYRKHRG